MSQNYNPSGGARSPKKPIINKWEGEGIVHPRSGNDNDQITFYPFKNKGGGAIHISIECREEGVDANGNPTKPRICYVPVNVMVNKNIPEDMLRAIRPKMRVHVVGPLKLESYDSKDGHRKSALTVDAFVFEILAAPQETVPPYQPPYGGQPYQGQGMYPGYNPQPGGYPGGIPAQPGYGGQQQMGGMPYGYQPPYGQHGQGQPTYPAQQNYPGAQPVYGPQAPYYQQQPGYAQAAGGQQSGYQQGGNPAPPYYQPPQGGPAAAAPAQDQKQPTDNQLGPEDDMPPGDPIHV